MNALSFTQEYLPDLRDMPPGRMAAMRERVVRHLSGSMPDVDMAPGTPTGDLIVTPMTAMLASVEEANSRLMSDLDLANVADGLIYSCAFVRAYLGNFAAYDMENLRSFGLVRLTFSSPDGREIPRASRFRFGTGDEWRPALASHDSAGLYLLAAGSSHPGTPDTYVLAQTSASSWAVDLPLTSEMTSPVSRGASGTASEVPSGLVGISAAVDFSMGTPPASLPQLAKAARRTAHSLTAGSRASIVAAAYRHWPEVRMVSPVVTGDVEMLRSPAGSAMVLQAPAVDIYMRSSRDLQVETQVVSLDYVQPDGGGPRVFRGMLQSLHLPSKILSVTWSGTTSADLVDSYTVFSKSSRQDLYGCMHCGTRFEELYLEVAPELDGLGTSLIPLSERVVGDETRQFATFSVTYMADPLMRVMASTMESDDHRPAGVDVLVKSGPLVDISMLRMRYIRREGVVMLLSAARDRIGRYLAGAGQPEVFHQTALHEIMHLAGAARTVGIDCDAVVRPSAASRLLRPQLADPGGAGLLGGWSAMSDPIDSLPVSSVAGLVPDVVVTDPMYEDGPPAAWAATSRTVRYLADGGAITFTEER
jgi:hypothetical protein